MNEENTQDLTINEKLDLVLAELADLRVWRTRVDAFIEGRSRDTKPILSQIHKEIADTRLEMREKFEQVEERLARTSEDAKGAHRLARLLHEDLLRMRSNHEELRERVTELEQQMPVRPEAA